MDLRPSEVKDRSQCTDDGKESVCQAALASAMFTKSTSVLNLACVYPDSNLESARKSVNASSSSFDAPAAPSSSAIATTGATAKPTPDLAYVNSVTPCAPVTVPGILTPLGYAAIHTPVRVNTVFTPVTAATIHTPINNSNLYAPVIATTVLTPINATAVPAHTTKSIISTAPASTSSVGSKHRPGEETPAAVQAQDFPHLTDPDPSTSKTHLTVSRCSTSSKPSREGHQSSDPMMQPVSQGSERIVSPGTPRKGLKPGVQFSDFPPRRGASDVMQFFHEQEKSLKGFQSQPKKARRKQFSTVPRLDQAVGTDQLDSLIRLMEELTSLKDENSKLRKRCDYLESTRRLLQAKRDFSSSSSSGFVTSHLKNKRHPHHHHHHRHGIQGFRRSRLSSFEDAEQLERGGLSFSGRRRKSKSSSRYRRSLSRESSQAQSEIVSHVTGVEIRRRLKTKSGRNSFSSRSSNSKQKRKRSKWAWVKDILTRRRLYQDLAVTMHAHGVQSRTSSLDYSLGVDSQGHPVSSRTTSKISSEKPRHPGASFRDVHEIKASQSVASSVTTGSCASQILMTEDQSLTSGIWMDPSDWCDNYVQHQGSDYACANTESSSVVEPSGKCRDSKKTRSSVAPTPATSSISASTEEKHSVATVLLPRGSSDPSVRTKEAAEDKNVNMSYHKLQSDQILGKSSVCSSAEFNHPSTVERAHDDSQMRLETKAYRSAWERVKAIIHTRKDSIKKKIIGDRHSADKDKEVLDSNTGAAREEHRGSDVVIDCFLRRSTPRASPVIARQQSVAQSPPSTEFSFAKSSTSGTRTSSRHSGSENVKVTNKPASHVHGKLRKKAQDSEQRRTPKLSCFSASKDDSDIGSISLSVASQDIPVHIIDLRDLRGKVPDNASEDINTEESNTSMEVLGAPSVSTEDMQGRVKSNKLQGEREKVRLANEKLRVQDGRLRALRCEAKLERLRISSRESAPRRDLNSLSSSIQNISTEKGHQSRSQQHQTAEVIEENSNATDGQIVSPLPCPILQPHDSTEDSSILEKNSESSLEEGDEDPVVIHECLTKSNIATLERANTQLLEDLHKKEIEYAALQEDVQKVNGKLSKVREDHAAEMERFYSDLEKGNFAGPVKLEVGELETAVGELEKKIKMMENVGEKLASSMESAAVGKWQSIEGEETVHTQLVELIDQMKGMLVQASQTEEIVLKTMALSSFETFYTQAMKLQVQMNNLRLSHLERNREILSIKRQLLLQEVNNLLLQADVTRRETELYQFHEAKRFGNLGWWSTASSREKQKPQARVELPSSTTASQTYPKPNQHKEARQRQNETGRINIPFISEEVTPASATSSSVSSRALASGRSLDASTRTVLDQFHSDSEAADEHAANHVTSAAHSVDRRSKVSPLLQTYLAQKPDGCAAAVSQSDVKSLAQLPTLATIMSASKNCSHFSDTPLGISAAPMPDPSSTTSDSRVTAEQSHKSPTSITSDSRVTAEQSHKSPTSTISDSRVTAEQSHKSPTSTTSDSRVTAEQSHKSPTSTTSDSRVTAEQSHKSPTSTISDSRVTAEQSHKSPTSITSDSRVTAELPHKSPTSTLSDSRVTAEQSHESPTSGTSDSRVTVEQSHRSPTSATSDSRVTAELPHKSPTSTLSDSRVTVEQSHESPTSATSDSRVTVEQSHRSPTSATSDSRVTAELSHKSPQAPEHSSMETKTVHDLTSKTKITTFCDSAPLHQAIVELRRVKRKMEKMSPNLQRTGSQKSSCLSPPKTGHSHGVSADAPDQNLSRHLNQEPKLARTAPSAHNYNQDFSVIASVETSCADEQSQSARDSDLRRAGDISRQAPSTASASRELLVSGGQGKFGSKSPRSARYGRRLLGQLAQEAKLTDFPAASPRGSPSITRGKPPLPSPASPALRSPSPSPVRRKGPRSKSAGDIGQTARSFSRPKHFPEVMDTPEHRRTVHELPYRQDGLRKSPSPTFHLPRVGVVSRVRKIKPAAELLEESQRYRSGQSIYSTRIMQRYLQREDLKRDKDGSLGVLPHTAAQNLSRAATPALSSGPSRASSDHSLKRTGSFRTSPDIATQVARKLSSSVSPEAFHQACPVHDSVSDGQVEKFIHTSHDQSRGRSTYRKISDIHKQTKTSSAPSLEAEHDKPSQVALQSPSSHKHVSDIPDRTVSPKLRVLEAKDFYKSDSDSGLTNHEPLLTFPGLDPKEEFNGRMSDTDKLELIMSIKDTEMQQGTSPYLPEHDAEKQTSTSRNNHDFVIGRLSRSPRPGRSKTRESKMETVGILCEQVILLDLQMSQDSQKSEGAESLLNSTLAHGRDFSERDQAPGSLPRCKLSPDAVPARPQTKVMPLEELGATASESSVSKVSTSVSPDTTEQRTSKKLSNTSWMHKSRHFFKV